MSDMHRIYHFLIVVFLSICFMVPVAWAQCICAKPSLNTGPLTSAKEMTRSMGRLHRMVLRHKECMQGCHSCFYGPFPGIVDYCHGLHDWKNGHYQEGLEYLKSAAGWGNKNAQYTLGLIYWAGHHVTANRAVGIAWLKLANQRHDNPHFAEIERSAIKAATPAQRRRAQHLLAGMRKRYGDKVAAARAWQRLRHWLATQQRVMWSVPSQSSPRNACLIEGHGVVSWRAGLASNPHAYCFAKNKTSSHFAKIMEIYFKGVRGTVRVGPLQAVPATAASTSGS